jgi:glutathione S-transferase
MCADSNSLVPMKLYYTSGSPFARMVRVVLRELNAVYEEFDIGFPPPPDYFEVNPLGQVPVLETDRGRIFPTSVILEFLLASAGSSRAPDDGGLPLARFLWRDGHQREDRQTLAVTLAMGDVLAATKYQEWAGLRPVGKNVLGFDIAARNEERVQKILDWLENRATPSGFLPGVLSVQDIALVCLILWTESRGPIAWRGRPRLESLVARNELRASFAATSPRPWRPDA